MEDLACELALNHNLLRPYQAIQVPLLMASVSFDWDLGFPRPTLAWLLGHVFSSECHLGQPKTVLELSYYESMHRRDLARQIF